MSDLRDRIAPIEQISAPDLWHDVQAKAVTSAPVPVERPTTARRFATIAVAFAVAVAAFTLMVNAFRSPAPMPIGPGPSPSELGRTVRSGELPAEFPAEIPIPAGVEPVAYRVGDGVVQVWFDAGPIDIVDVYQGFPRAGPGSSLGGIRDIHRRVGDYVVTVMLDGGGCRPRALHGCEDFRAFDDWTLYIVAADDRQRLRSLE